jgi:hypothetical protein
MTDRLQDAHSAPIDVPLTLFGIAIGADVLGRIVGSKRLHGMARYLMPAAATAAALAAASDGGGKPVAPESGRPLVRPRRPFETLPMASAAAALAVWRWRRETPNAAYLALGLAAIRAGTGRRPNARLFVRDGGAASLGVERPAATLENATPQVVAAVRTEAADRLRGL